MIEGLTDSETLANTRSKPCIFAYKGTEQEIVERTNRKTQEKYEQAEFGHDLLTFFRIETSDIRIKNFLLLKYKDDAKRQNEYRAFIKRIRSRGKIPLRDESLFLSDINLYLPYDDQGLVFDTFMGRYTKKGDKISGLLSKCNKKFIYQKTEPIVTESGNVKKQIVECQETCPIAGTKNECPHGCTETGVLVFYIRELFDCGNFELCSLTVRGMTDIVGISAFLQNEVYQIRGTINRAEHSIIKTQGMLPFVLSRRQKKINRPVIVDGKRTGKTTQALTYAAVLKIDPEFVVWERALFNVQELLAIGVKPENAILEQVYDTKILEPAIGSLAVWKIGEAQIEEMGKVFHANGWSKSAFTRLLKEKLNCKRGYKDINTLTRNGYSMLLEYLRSPIVKREYKILPEVTEVLDVAPLTSVE